MSFADQLGSSNNRAPPRSGFQGPPQRTNYGTSTSNNNSYSNSSRVGNDSYDQIVRSVSDNVRQLSVNVNQIKSYSDTLGTSRDSLENREQLRRLIDSSRVLVVDTNESFKRMSTSITPDDKTRKLQQQKLVKDFENTIKKFSDTSKFAAEKEKSTPLPQKAPPKTIDNYDDDVDLEKQGLIEAQKIHQLQLDNERQFMDALIADREQGIKEIEKTVYEVNEIFRDLSHLVQEQGTMIDNIESHIEESVVRTNDGVEELRKANDYQKSSRNKMCCLAVIILVVAAIVVLVVYFVFIK